MKRFTSFFIMIAILLGMVPAAAMAVEYDDVGDLSENRRAVALDGKYGFLDENGQLVIPCRYDSVGEFKAGLVEVRMGDFWDGQHGVIDLDGNEVLPCIYDIVNIYEDGLISVSLWRDGRLNEGLFDRTGKELLPIEYDGIGGYGGYHLFWKRDEGQWLGTYGLMDSEGRVVLPMVYQDITMMEDGSFRVFQDEKFGLLDGSFQTVLPLTYDGINEWEGYYVVSQNGKCGVVDRTGKVKTALEYDELYWMEGGVCIVSKKGKWGLLSYPEGKTIIPPIYDEADESYGGLIRVTQGGRVGMLSPKTGEVLIPVEFNAVSNWGYGYTGPDNVIITRRGDLFGAYTETGEELFPCQFGTLERLSGALRNGEADPTVVESSSQAAGVQVDWYPQVERITRIYGSDRMALVKDGRFALCGLDGVQYTDFVFDAIGEQRVPGEFMAAKNGKWGIIDSFGNTVADFFCDTQEEARDGVEVRFVSKWADGSAPYALADKSGKILTDYKYWDYGGFQMGLAVVSDGKAYGFLDTTGREVTPFKYDIVEPFGEDGFAIVYAYDGRRYNAVDTAGRELWAEAEPYARVWRAGCGLWGRGCEWGTVTFWNSQGELVIPAQYIYHPGNKGGMLGNRFDKNGVAEVYLKDGQAVYIDTRGNRVEGPLDWSEDSQTDLHEGLIWARADGFQLPGDWEMEKGWGFKDEAGELVVPYLYDAVGYFDQGYASVRLDGVYGMLKSPLLEDEDAHKVSDWAVAEVTAATEAGYVTPRCSTYQTRTITRLQFAELAVNYLEKKTGQSITPALADTFTDTSDETVLKASAAGIVQGVGEGRFDPGGLLTREQLATMLWRAMAKAGMTVEAPADLTAYTDGGEVASWAADSLSALVGLKVMEGTGGNALSPKASCTVEQAILLVYRGAEK